MKTILSLIVGVALVLPVYLTAQEQEPTEPELRNQQQQTEQKLEKESEQWKDKEQAKEWQRDDMDQARQDRDMSQARTEAYHVSNILGSTVVDNRGEEVGTISNLVINPMENKVSHAEISYGGFLGMGEQSFTVPFDNLKYDADEEQYSLTGTKAELQKEAEPRRGEMDTEPGIRGTEEERGTDRGVTPNQQDTETERRGY